MHLRRLPILKAIERTGWTPTMILTTHHHPDHVEANLALKKRFGLKIVGPKAEASKIPGIDEELAEGSKLEFAGQPVQVIETPGHTAGHICYYLPKSHVAFVADTLFAMGCGKLLERPAPVMFHSLTKLVALPATTTLYCGHEYTLTNARFALTIDPTNSALKERAAKVEKLRAKDKPTLPTTLGGGTFHQPVHPLARSGDPPEPRHGKGERRRGLRRDPQAQGQFLDLMDAAEIIAALGMIRHPEGGWYAETLGTMGAATTGTLAGEAIRPRSIFCSSAVTCRHGTASRTLQRSGTSTPVHRSKSASSMRRGYGFLRAGRRP